MIVNISVDSSLKFYTFEIGIYLNYGFFENVAKDIYNCTMNLQLYNEIFNFSWLVMVVVYMIT